MKRRVVITGIGVVTCVGTSKDTFWDAIIKGKSGIKKISFFDPTPFRSQIAGEIKEFDPLQFIDIKEVRDMDRVSHLTIAATEEAIKDAGFKPDENAGIIIGTGIGGITSDDFQHTLHDLKGPRYVQPMAIPTIMYNAIACHVSRRYGLMGSGYTVATACTSGANAIGEAYRLIKHGYTDVMVAGGAEATISPGIWSGWCAMRVLSTKNDDPAGACRPFSKDRSGMVISEGAGIVILEELEHALKRSSNIYAEVIGYGSSYDARHITAPNVYGQMRAISIAMKDANISPDKIDYIKAHGTSTVLNDKIETETIKKMFGDKAYSIPVSSIKSMIGHTIGASGAIELIACCLSLRDSIIPPTINYTERDPDCDLDYVPNKARKARLNVIMTNSFGFGGINGVLILRRCE